MQLTRGQSVVSTLLIGILVAPISGFVLFARFIEGDMRLLIQADIAGIPLAVYAFFTGAPIGVLSAAFGILVSLRLSTHKPHLSLAGWLMAGAFCGFVSGFLVGMILGLLQADFETARRFAMKVCGLSGTICGLLIGGVWFLDSREKAAS